jgi:hypothetical protein
MTTSREASSSDTVRNPRRQRWQFALSTLLAGMLVSAIFFGYSGLWWRRVLEERERSALIIRRLEADLQAEQQAHRQTQARLIVAQSQLQDAVGVRMDQQIADRAAAEQELKMIEQYAARLRSELEASRQETEKLRVEAKRNQPGGVP